MASDDILFSSFLKPAIELPPSPWSSSSSDEDDQDTQSSCADEEREKNYALHFTSDSSDTETTTDSFAEDADSRSTSLTASPSLQASESDEESETQGQDEIDLEDFDSEAFTVEKTGAYNTTAGLGQGLEDAVTPKKVASSMENPAKRSDQDPMTLPIAKQINIFIRGHPFLDNCLATFTKSQRRLFERNVYDFSRGLGLNKSEAKKSVIKARECCGEEYYDSDVSALEGEVDDSTSIIATLPSANRPKPIFPFSYQVPSISQTESGSSVKRRVGEDSAVTEAPSKKRKASTMREGWHTARQSELVRLNEEIAKRKGSDQKGSQSLQTDGSKPSLKGFSIEPIAEKMPRETAEKARNIEERMRQRAQANPADKKSNLHGQHEDETKIVTDYLDYLEEWREFDENLKNERERKEALVELQNPAEAHQHRNKKRRSNGRHEDGTEERKLAMSDNENHHPADFRHPMIQPA